MEIMMNRVDADTSRGKYSAMRVNDIEKISLYSDRGVVWIRFMDKRGKLTEAPLINMEVFIHDDGTATPLKRTMGA